MWLVIESSVVKKKRLLSLKKQQKKNPKRLFLYREKSREREREIMSWLSQFTSFKVTKEVDSSSS